MIFVKIAKLKYAADQNLVVRNLSSALLIHPDDIGDSTNSFIDSVISRDEKSSIMRIYQMGYSDTDILANTPPIDINKLLVIKALKKARKIITKYETTNRYHHIEYEE